MLENINGWFIKETLCGMLIYNECNDKYYLKPTRDEAVKCIRQLVPVWTKEEMDSMRSKGRKFKHVRKESYTI